MLRARVRRAVATDDAAADVRFRVEIAEAPGRAVALGTLVIQRGADAWTQQVTAASCSEAADALALIAAMLMDPEAQPPPPPPPPPRPKPPQEGALGPPPSPYVPPEIPEWSVAANASFMLTDSGAPRLEPGALASVNARRNLERSDFDWEFGLYFAIKPPSSSVGTGDGALYEWWAVGLSVCPISWPPGPIRLRACGSVETGTLTRTDHWPTPERNHAEWLAVTTGVRWQWAMLPFLELELAVSGVFPVSNANFQNLTRTRGIDTYETGPGGRGSGGLTLTFP